jgi:hypothetical protein
MALLAGDLVILGVGGKMGPTLARMAKRASDMAGVPRRVIGISRFSEPKLRYKLHSWGIETHECDLLDSKSATYPDREPCAVGDGILLCYLAARRGSHGPEIVSSCHDTTAGA